MGKLDKSQSKFKTAFKGYNRSSSGLALPIYHVMCECHTLNLVVSYRKFIKIKINIRLDSLSSNFISKEPGQKATFCVK